ncbi:hypothetical protein SDC9_129337 [bioreactor metagenome]|uniref:Uncharacterized protein n=1 Tax=bioreactor metagenome TaxID=1076179 RepID=A0A645CYP3_9ZZZZ
MDHTDVKALLQFCGQVFQQIGRQQAAAFHVINARPIEPLSLYRERPSARFAIQEHSIGVADEEQIDGFVRCVRRHQNRSNLRTDRNQLSNKTLLPIFLFQKRRHFSCARRISAATVDIDDRLQFT